MKNVTVIVTLERKDVIRLLKSINLEFKEDETIVELWLKYLEWKETKEKF